MASMTFHGQAACILDADGRFLNVSPSLAAFFAMDGQALRGRSLVSCMDPAEATQVEPLLADLAAGKHGSYRFQVRLIGPGQVPTWVAMRLGPGGTDPQGRPMLIAVFEEPPRAS